MESLNKGTVDVFQSFIDSRLSDIHTSMPGKIVSYDESTNRATVLPLVKWQRKINNNLITIDIPPIENVPVVFFRTTAFYLKFPIKKNDGCIIHFSESSIGNFLNGNGLVVDPEDPSKFSLTDAICVPGLWGGNLPSNAPTIEITDSGNINLLSGDSSFVKGEDLESLLNTFLNALSVVVGGDVGTNAAAINAIAAAASAALPNVSAIKSTKIKGE